MSGSERGSASLVLVAVAAVAALLGVVVADTGRYLAAAAQAQTAADAAALAAAPVTFLPFGATGSPAREAAVFATANGARLVWCRCRIDRSLADREVVVRVRLAVDLLIPATAAVEAESRARFSPAALGGYADRRLRSSHGGLPAR